MTSKRAFIQTGFTLIEIMITVIILAVLVSIVTVNYPDIKKKNEYTSAVAQMRTIAAAEKSYYLTQTLYGSTTGTAHTNALLAIMIADGYFNNYRVNTIAGTPPSFNITVSSGTSPNDALYTFDPNGNRISCAGPDCLP